MAAVAGFFFGKAHAAGTGLELAQGNERLILRRIARQAAIWTEMARSSFDGPLEPEIGRNELEQHRVTILQKRKQ